MKRQGQCPLRFLTVLQISNVVEGVILGPGGIAQQWRAC